MVTDGILPLCRVRPAQASAPSIRLRSFDEGEAALLRPRAMNPSGETTCCDCPCQVASCFTFEEDGKRAQAKGLDRGSKQAQLVD
jgi:hypothetical protein